MAKLYKTLNVAGSRRKVCAIKLSDKYMMFNEDGQYVHLWSGDDDKLYELRVIRGKQAFLPFRTAA